MLTATILVLALWLAFVWIFDLDGIRDAARRMRLRNHESSRVSRNTTISERTRNV